MALESGRAAGCLRGFSCGSYLTEYLWIQTGCLQLGLETIPSTLSSASALPRVHCGDCLREGVSLGSTSL